MFKMLSKFTKVVFLALVVTILALSNETNSVAQTTDPIWRQKR